MKLIPVYSWNKTMYSFEKRSTSLSRKPWFQGVLLLTCVIVAMLLANLPGTSHLYHSFLDLNLQVHIFSDSRDIDLLFPREMNVEKFINDFLMVIFFFTVGLEIKREVTYGELSSVRKALMPVIAAVGGVLAPAAIYFAVNNGTMAAGGWGIPTATDIAFAVCILSVLGDKVPVSLKVFLTALAIADDLIAILVVAIFYGGSINFGLLAIALGIVLFTLLMRSVGERRIIPYLAMAALVWILFYYSGIHATMSGVVMAFIIPSSARYNQVQYYRKRKNYTEILDAMDDGSGYFPNDAQKMMLKRLEDVSHGTLDMSYRVEQALNPWVNFLILPVFALANAGVSIPDISYFNIFAQTVAGHPEFGHVGLGIFLGLVLGKPIGITLLSFLAVKTKAGAMPEKASWPMFFAVACLGGIGFTMSIFVDTLSFGNVTDTAILTQMRDAGKIAVLLGSIFAGVLGTLLVSVLSRRSAQ